MPTETTARAHQPAAPDETDYHAFWTALSTSARGRAFLAEYARRSRHADTQPLLNALERLQSSLGADVATPAEVLVKQKLRALLDDIAAAQSEIESRVMAIRTAKLADLIVMVEQRLAAIMAPAETVPPEPAPAPRIPEDPVEDARAHLAVVPPSDQPELPIPSPLTGQPPTISLVRADKAIADVAFVDPQRAAANDGVKSGPATASPSGAAAAERPPADPLASIMALSEEERIAMFT
jgi:hypothetical protein